MIRGYPAGIKPDPYPVGDEISPRRDSVVKMVGGHMTEVCQSRRQQDRVIIEDSQQQEPDNRIFPGVEE